MKEPTSVAVADGVYTISPTIVGDTFGDRGPGAERKHDVDDWRQWHVVVERVGARLEDHDVDSVQRVVYFGQDPDLLLLVLDVDFVVDRTRLSGNVPGPNWRSERPVSSRDNYLWCHLNKFVGIFEKLISFWNSWDVLVDPGEREF